MFNKKHFLLIGILSLGFYINFSKNIVSNLGSDDLAMMGTVLQILKEKKLIGYYNPFVAPNFFLIPFFYIFGPTTFAYILPRSLFIVISLSMTYVFTKKFYNENVAIVATLLLCFFPMFVVLGFNEWPFLPFFLLSLLLLSYEYYKSGNCKHLLLFALVSGIGVYFKTVVIYFILSIFASFFIIKLFFPLNKVKLKKGEIFVSLLLFLIGISLIYFAYGFKTLIYMSEGFIETKKGHKNFALPTNILTKIRQLEAAFSSRYLLYENKKSPALSLEVKPQIFPFNFLLFSTSFFTLLLLKNKKDLFLIFMIIIYTILTTFVPGVMLPLHFYPIFPIFSMIIGRFMNFFLYKNSLMLTVFAMLLALFFLLNIYQIYYVRPI
jgi:4-amino-4-deoxy-L-arabinose transferase-like glycosyltransferase